MPTIHSTIISAGVSFVDAPAEVAGRLSLGATRIDRASAAMHLARPDLETVLLALDDRVELLVAGGDLDPPTALSLLHDALAVDATGEAAPCLHGAVTPAVHSGLGVLVHVLRLVCGLEPGRDSPGEIVDRLHLAWRTAHDAGSAGPVLRRVVQLAVEEGERARLRRRLGPALDRTHLAALATEEQIDRALVRFCTSVSEHRIAISDPTPHTHVPTSNHHLGELVSPTFLRGADRRARPDR